MQGRSGQVGPPPAGTGPCRVVMLVNSAQQAAVTV